eukprot:GDKK01053934.1.p1 GENE.GDKK01053934.1~~GDKK01053934.1.p1  ORF type:complete len:838 (+),score=180.94 GDKK01053934.1:359-2515(+)
MKVIGSDISRKEIGDAFDELDEDGGGSLDSEEFVNVYATLALISASKNDPKIAVEVNKHRAEKKKNAQAKAAHDGTFRKKGGAESDRDLRRKRSALDGSASESEGDDEPVGFHFSKHAPLFEMDPTMLSDEDITANKDLSDLASKAQKEPANKAIQEELEKKLVEAIQRKHQAYAEVFASAKILPVVVEGSKDHLGASDILKHKPFKDLSDECRRLYRHPNKNAKELRRVREEMAKIAKDHGKRVLLARPQELIPLHDYLRRKYLDWAVRDRERAAKEEEEREKHSFLKRGQAATAKVATTAKDEKQRLQELAAARKVADEITRRVGVLLTKQGGVPDVLSSMLTAEQQELVRKQFRSVDADGGGSVDKKEFMQYYSDVISNGMTRKEIGDIFEMLDEDGGGSLDEDEFVNVYVMLGLYQASKRDPKIAQMVAKMRSDKQKHKQDKSHDKEHLTRQASVAKRPEGDGGTQNTFRRRSQRFSTSGNGKDEEEEGSPTTEGIGFRRRSSRFGGERRESGGGPSSTDGDELTKRQSVLNARGSEVQAKREKIIEQRELAKRRSNLNQSHRKSVVGFASFKNDVPGSAAQSKNDNDVMDLGGQVESQSDSGSDSDEEKPKAPSKKGPVQAKSVDRRRSTVFIEGDAPHTLLKAPAKPSGPSATPSRIPSTVNVRSPSSEVNRTSSNHASPAKGQSTVKQPHPPAQAVSPKGATPNPRTARKK